MFIPKGMTESRPLDFLNSVRNQRVFVELKNGWQITGILRAFDIHVNLVLTDAEAKKPVYSEEGEKTGYETVRTGNILIRGDTVRIVHGG